MANAARVSAVTDVEVRYRRGDGGGFWMALGATAVLFGLLAFLWAVA